MGFMMLLKMIMQTGLIIVLAGSPALGWVPAAPDEAIFFEDANFTGESLALRLQPGIRHRLMPGLGGMDKKISSIIVGEKVKVLAFTNPDFGGGVREYVYTIAENMPDDDQIASLIVCPTEEPPQGVLFIQKRISEVKTPSQRPWHYITGKGIFFPLPESERESEAKFPRLAGDWNNKVRYIYVAPAVEADLFENPEFSGRPLSLPGPEAGQQTVFDLNTFGFYNPKKSPPGVISSLIVRTRGSSKK
jgi:hypothetical protein